MSSKQTGFSVPHALLAIVVVSIVGFTGWYVWQAKRNTEAAYSSTPSAATLKDRPKPTPNSGPLPAQQKPTYVPPSDYLTYEHAAPGFAISYPKEWGQLAAQAKPYLIGYDFQTPYIDNKSLGDSFLQGRFGVNVIDAASLQVITQKYGATVAAVKTANGYDWKVVSVNPADTENKVGDTYPVKVTTSKSGVKLFAFNWSDEGALHGRWVFEAEGKFMTVSLPPIMREMMAGVSDQDAALYEALIKSIQDSVKVEK